MPSRRTAAALAAAAIAATTILAAPAPADAKPAHAARVIKVKAIPDPPKLPGRHDGGGPVICPRPIPDRPCR